MHSIGWLKATATQVAVAANNAFYPPSSSISHLPSPLSPLPPSSEFSESWTAASLARIVDDVRVARNNDSNAMLPLAKSRHPRPATRCLPPWWPSS